MQIQTLNTATNNKPNFTAIKSVRCSGLYKKFPELGRELVDAFRLNPKAMDFCRENDVDIVLYARKNGTDKSTESSLHIFFDNPVRSKFKKILDFINNSREQICLSALGTEWNVEKSLRSSTKTLKEYILPPSDDPLRKSNGVLDSHIEIVINKIQEKLTQKTEKEAAKTKKDIAKADAKSQKVNAQKALNDSIKNLQDDSNYTKVLYF